MEPRIVDQAPMPPGQCLFSQDIDGPWIDLGVVAPWIRPYGYLSVKYVESLARDVLGMVPVEPGREEIQKLQAQILELREENERLQAYFDAREGLVTEKAQAYFASRDNQKAVA